MSEDAHVATVENKHRRVRSFVTRAGRISNAQQRAIDQLLPIYGIQYRPEVLEFGEIFGRNAPTVLEIGFGMGETTAHLAESHPTINFLGIEVHTPGLGALLKMIGERSLANLRVLQHDAVEVLEEMIAPASLAGVHVFFPDPWQKARHHKRRLLNAGLVGLLASRLKEGGYLHCATDWQNYAEQIFEVLSAEPRLDLGGSQESRQNPLMTRPVTKFENRGLKLGHGVWDLIALRNQAHAGLRG